MTAARITETSDRPLVTVAMLSYNTGEFVGKALACLKRQTYRNFEVIVVDDGSSDDSVAAIRRCADDLEVSLTLLENEVNLGIPASLNRALRQGKGELVTWLSDDLWEDNRLETVVRCFAELRDDVQVLFGDAIVIDGAGSEIGYLSPASTFEAVGIPHEPAIIPPLGECAVIPRGAAREALYWRSFLPAPTVTVRRALYDAIGPYDEALAVEDVDCWFRATAVADFAYLRVPLVKYRQHSSNFSSGGKATYLAALAEVLHRHSPGDPYHRRVIKRHLREESFRVASGLLAAGARTPALRTLRKHYVPNLQPSMTCFKESCRLIGQVAGFPRPAEVK